MPGWPLQLDGHTHLYECACVGQDPRVSCCPQPGVTLLALEKEVHLLKSCGWGGMCGEPAACVPASVLPELSG